MNNLFYKMSKSPKNSLFCQINRSFKNLPTPVPVSAVTWRCNHNSSLSLTWVFFICTQSLCVFDCQDKKKKKKIKTVRVGGKAFRDIEALIQGQLMSTHSSASSVLHHLIQTVNTDLMLLLKECTNLYTHTKHQSNVMINVS